MVDTKELERNYKAFGNRRRLDILKYLKRSEKATVGDIATKIGLSFKSTSRHLAVLSAIAVLSSEQVGLYVYYSLSADKSSVVQQVLDLL